jgi:CheY-like chemotaxis protein
MDHDSLSALTIVVVEDHDDSRRALGLFLGHLGAHVALASNAAEAIDKIKDARPNLVLSDIQLPDRNGFELLREIRALGSSGGGTVPVIALSGFLTGADRTRMLRAGFHGFLPKPFHPERLLETIQTVLAD